MRWERDRSAVEKTAVSSFNVSKLSVFPLGQVDSSESSQLDILMGPCPRMLLIGVGEPKQGEAPGALPKARV